MAVTRPGCNFGVMTAHSCRSGGADYLLVCQSVCLPVVRSTLMAACLILSMRLSSRSLWRSVLIDCWMHLWLLSYCIPSRPVMNTPSLSQTRICPDCGLTRPCTFSDCGWTRLRSGLTNMSSGPAIQPHGFKGHAMLSLLRCILQTGRGAFAYDNLDSGGLSGRMRARG